MSILGRNFPVILLRAEAPALKLKCIWEAIGTHALNAFSIINDKDYAMKAVEVSVGA